MELAYGERKIWSVIIWFLVFVGYGYLGLAYLTPFIFSTPFNSLASSSPVEDCKSITEERKKRDEDTF